jgi:3-oxoacyl-[acyl-carrier-protein] synthase III
MRSKIVSTGMYVPSNVITNKELEKMMDTSCEPLFCFRQI